MEKISIAWLTDIKEMPRFDSKVTNGTNSVSTGKVTWTEQNKVTCIKHGAMLCVSENRQLWRCPTCNEGGYLFGYGLGEASKKKKWWQFMHSPLTLYGGKR